MADKEKYFIPIEGKLIEVLQFEEYGHSRTNDKESPYNPEQENAVGRRYYRAEQKNIRHHQSES